jgi:hypothetical protein
MEIVLAAATTGLFGIIIAIVQKGRRENKEDHGLVITKLDGLGNEIRKDLRQVRYELNAHRDDLKNHIRKDH